jgi:hypothetical protein
MRPGEPLSLTVTLPNEQWIEIPEAVVRWSRGQAFTVENVENIAIESQPQAWLQRCVRRLVHERADIVL